MSRVAPLGSTVKASSTLPLIWRLSASWGYSGELLCVIFNFAASAARSGARMNRTVLSALAPSAAASTGLRPAWSEDRPASSKVTITAAA